MAVLPNFLVIGALKAGTTSLYHYLRGHPQVFLPAKKEPNFFVTEARGTWNRGVDWYEHLFDGAEGAEAVGEASITYTLYPYFAEVPARISRVIPDVRLIYLVRHPIERMRSHFWQRIRKGRETETSIERALFANPSYVDASRYAMQIEQYLEYFPLERILIVKSEDLMSRRELTLARMFTFLGVDPDRMPRDVEREYNRGEYRRRRRQIASLLPRLPGYSLLASASPQPVKELKRRLTTQRMGSPPVISDSVTHELEDMLRDDVRRLRNYAGQRFDGWGIA